MKWKINSARESNFYNLIIAVSMSQEFDDHLKSRGIVPQLTPPGTP